LAFQLIYPDKLHCQYHPDDIYEKAAVGPASGGMPIMVQSPTAPSAARSRTLRCLPARCRDDDLGVEPVEFDSIPAIGATGSENEAGIMATEPKFTGPDDDCAVSTHSGRFEGNLLSDYAGNTTLTDWGKIYDRRKIFAGSLIPSQAK
jgi:hypothetical protein